MADESVQQARYPEESKATTSFVLAILGWIVCMVLAPIAWVMANKELQGIAAGRRDPSSQGMAKAAQVLGIIGTIVWGVILVAMVALLAVSVAGDEVSRTFSEISRDLEG